MRRAFLVLAILALLVPASALAASPHFIRASASGPDASGDLTVNFKIAGLGDNQTLTVTTTAKATVEYACRNNGGQWPNDPRKQQLSGPVSASGSFTSGKNGQITGSLTLSPPASTLDCPNGQHVEMVSVSYTDVVVSGGDDSAAIDGTFSRVFFTDVP